MLDRADYADFDCHNSIRLEAEHFLNTLALPLMYPQTNGSLTGSQ